MVGIPDESGERMMMIEVNRKYLLRERKAKRKNPVDIPWLRLTWFPMEYALHKPKIQQIGIEELADVIACCAPLGLFLAKDSRKWVAVDNATGDAWTEEFHWEHQAIRWLRGKLEAEQEPIQK